MSVQTLPQVEPEREALLVSQAREGDRAALGALVESWRRPLFGYIYRMVTHRQDAEDLLQDVLLRVLESLPSFRGDARFKTWLFGIATHVCLDHLRRKQRWRLEAQLESEEDARADPAYMAQLQSTLARQDFVFEIREHIAFCFACLGRTLPPEEQATLLLREVLGFTAEEAARILSVSEPVFRHRLAAARKVMVESYQGLCRLVNKSGPCWQCRGLRELAPERNRGEDLVQIEVAPGLAVTPENLLDARLEIARQADLEDGRSQIIHEQFFSNLTRREEG